MNKGLMVVCLTLIGSLAQAADSKPVLKMSPQTQRPEQWEQQQLEKARQAAAETREREQKVLSRQQSGEWQTQQQQKAQAAAQVSSAREQKYLEQAREAAAKERKIPRKSDQ
ncbi:hypothetical protein [Shewanella sp. GXUN23E]|uniref:hypothetical protein n=1 Tax=Shewanella sp. GXUN23E TaxID=3422498 RepID=UPI003D7D75BD